MNKILSTALGAGLLLCAVQSFAGSGSSQADPILPNRIVTGYLSASGQPVAPRFEFDNPQSGLWFDPPLIEGFDISVTSAFFGSVTAPMGMSGLQLLVNGQIVDADFGNGETYSFASQVKSFTVRNVHPAIDAASPDLAAALPLKLTFYGSVSSMTGLMAWTSIPSAIPESDIYLLMIGGLAALGLLKRRR